MDMYFRILHDEASGELTYLLADQDAREAVLVDPRGRDLPLLAALLAERELLASGPAQSAQFWSSAQPQALQQVLPLLWGAAAEVQALPG